MSFKTFMFYILDHMMAGEGVVLFSLLCEKDILILLVMCLCMTLVVCVRYVFEIAGMFLVCVRDGLYVLGIYMKLVCVTYVPQIAVIYKMCV